MADDHALRYGFFAASQNFRSFLAGEFLNPVDGKTLFKKRGDSQYLKVFLR